MGKKTREAATEKSEGKNQIVQFNAEEAGIVPFDPEQFFDSKDNGLDDSDIQLPVIEIAHTVGVFKMPNGMTTQSFIGTILHHNRCNAYWANENSKEPPDCMSMDGKHPIPSPSQKSIDCASCKFNKFKTDPKGGKGKACKNMRRLHIIIPGEAMPLRLTLSPMSLKNGSTYLTELTCKGVNHKIVNTEFSLEVKERGQEKFSVVKMALKGYIWGAPIIPQFVIVREEKNGMFVSVKRENPEYCPIWSKENIAMATRVKEIYDQWIEVMTQSPVDDADYPDITENPESENNEDE